MTVGVTVLEAKERVENVTGLHAFCSRPHFWEEEALEDFQRMMTFNAEPSRLASVFGISPEVIRP